MITDTNSGKKRFLDVPALRIHAQDLSAALLTGHERHPGARNTAKSVPASRPAEPAEPASTALKFSIMPLFKS